MNDLGITKAEGRAALRLLCDDEADLKMGPIWRIWRSWGWLQGADGDHFAGGHQFMPHFRLALALVASIAGVVDAKGNPK